MFSDVVEKKVYQLTKEELSSISDYNTKQEAVMHMLQLNQKIDSMRANFKHRETMFCFVRTLIAKHFIRGIKFTLQPFILNVRTTTVT